MKLYNLKNKTTLAGKLSELFSLNIALHPSSLSSLIPFSLRPDEVNGYSFISLLIGTIVHLRPANIKPCFGLKTRFAGYGIPVKRTSSFPDGSPMGFFHKFFLSHPLPAALGNILTTFHFDTGHIECHRIGSQLVASMDIPHNSQYHFSGHGNLISSPKQGQVFNSWEESVRYFSRLTNLITWNPLKETFEYLEIPLIGTPMPVLLDDLEYPWIKQLADNSKSKTSATKEGWHIESVFYLEGKESLWKWETPSMSIHAL